MDALAGYGSDSSSSSGAHPPRTTNPLADMLGGSDSDDSSVNLAPPQQDITNQPAAKRQKTEEITKSIILPPPDTSANSIYLWDKNYLDKKQPTIDKLNIDSKRSSKDLSEKLEKLSKGLEISWADHLKSQHEFHNPFFFLSVVVHFGISDPLGSQMTEATMSLQPYETELFPRAVKEET